MGEAVFVPYSYIQNLYIFLERNLITVLQGIVAETAAIGVIIRTNLWSCHTSGKEKGLLEQNRVKILISSSVSPYGTSYPSPTIKPLTGKQCQLSENHFQNQPPFSALKLSLLTRVLWVSFNSLNQTRNETVLPWYGQSNFIFRALLFLE